MAPLAIIAIVVISVVVISAGYLLLVAKPAPSGPGDNQQGGGPGGGTTTLTTTTPTTTTTTHGGGGEEIEVPVYPGASEFSIPSEMKSGFGIPADAACEGYTTSADAEDVMDWYKEQMGDWTLEDEISVSPSDQPGVTVHIQYYRKDDNGAFVFAMNSPQMGGTIFGIVTGSWSLVQGCGGGPPDGGPGDNQPGSSPTENVYVDWSDAYVFTDPKGDFWLGGGSPPSVIEFPPSDIIKVYVTNDNQYLYLKFEVDGAIPTFPIVYNGDNVRILVMDLVIDSDHSTSTGNIMYYAGGDMMLDLWFGSPSQAGGVLYTFARYAFYDPTGEECVGDWENCTFIGGGVGENFVAARFPLSGLGLESGMSVNVFSSVEVESDAYHHFARDTMPAEGQWNTNLEIR